MIRRDFHEVLIEGLWKPDKKGTLVIGNHISWWDGFWGLYLNNLFLKKKFHVLMLEEQLTQRMFLNKAGAFSIRPGTRDMVKSLEYTRNLLKDNKNMVLFFPQGKIESMSNAEIHFEKGIDRIVGKNENTQVLFYAAFVDYFSNRKPSLYFYLTEAEKVPSDTEELQSLYACFYRDACKKQRGQKR
ncbi:MAG TPA: lysophospholipid acyltransferase family protein [Prolixibacteraceae bacterium]|nr:lysophospholipid acyltransferase family protein [Prolixibacteraceae bacterium]